MFNNCQARRSRDGESMECGRCGLQWDVNDQDRPQCRTDKEISKEKGLQALHEMRHDLEVDVVHTCSNCENNLITRCAWHVWGAGSGVDRDTLAILMNVDNSKCTKWRLKR